MGRDNLFWRAEHLFGRRRLKRRSEKTEVARSKRRHRKGGGQAATKKRSPLRRMWNRGRARSAKVHACGAQLKGEFQEISSDFARFFRNFARILPGFLEISRKSIEFANFYEF